MQKWKNILLCAVVSFMFLFMTVGYAQLSDTLHINGTVTSKELEMIYIKSFSMGAISNTSGTVSISQSGYIAIKHGNYTLKQQDGSQIGGKITFTVTVKNNSGMDLYYTYISPINDPNDTNDTDTKFRQYCNITFERSDNVQDTRLVKQGDTATFSFTIQNMKRKSWNNNYDLKMDGLETTIVFSPETDGSATEDATKTLVTGFASILAGKGPLGSTDGKIMFQGKQYTGPEILSKLLTTSNGGVLTNVGTGGYMGNVEGAPQNQKDLVEAMFGEQILMPIGNNLYSVNILIKNQQIDNDSQRLNDMVIYITADQLYEGGGRWSGNNLVDIHNVPVYALVYIQTSKGVYQYCNHLFEGQAPVCDFDGNFGNDCNGNFNTNVWDSTEYKNLTDSHTGSFGPNGIGKDGELDDAYKLFAQNNSNYLIPLEKVLEEQTNTDVQ